MSKLRNPKFLLNGVVVATVYGDPRFKDGEQIRTSIVEKIQTMNTLYEVEFADEEGRPVS